jgi:hypothetical protein
MMLTRTASRDPGEDNKNKHKLSGGSSMFVYQGAKRTLTTMMMADYISLPGVFTRSIMHCNGKPFGSRVGFALHPIHSS